MKNIRDWESRRTHQAWGTGSGNPALMVLACLVVNIIASIVAIVFNLAVIDDGNNDYGYGTGWIMFIIAPGLGVVWALIDAAVCHYSVLDPIYYLVESALLGPLNIGFAIPGIMIYSWSTAWVPGIFILISAVVYIYIAVVCSIKVHKQRTRPQSSGVA